MLLPWRKQTTLLLEPAGITVITANKPVSVIKNDTAAVSMSQIWQVLIDLLSQQQFLLQKQQITIVLSPHFAGTHTMPWRENIVKSADWHALAQAYIKNVYGQASNEKTLTVSPQTFGKPVLITVINSAWLNQLETLAQQLDLKLMAVTSLFDYLSDIERRNIASNDWLLIASQQRLLLAVRHKGQWQHFASASPLAHLLNKECVDLITRSSVYLRTQPTKVHLFGVNVEDLTAISNAIDFTQLSSSTAFKHIAALEVSNSNGR